MANSICTDIVCDTTVQPAAPPPVPVPTPTCGLPTNGVFTHATIHTNANGCISHIESGEPYLYTPDPCCPSNGTGTGGGGTGLQGPQGDPGTAATVTIGSVATTAPGTAATVTNVGTNTAAILNITIPQGEPGLDGATPSGLDYNANGFVIEDGLVQTWPLNWPPVMNFSPATVSGDGITMTFAKDGAGAVTVTINAASLLALQQGQHDAQQNSIDVLTNELNTAQVNIASLQSDLLALQTQHDALKTRVDAAGIP
jgi:hypothetical protein